MNQGKEIYTRTDVTQKLGIQAYILSLWEKEFAVPTITAGTVKHFTRHKDLANLPKSKPSSMKKGIALKPPKNP